MLTEADLRPDPAEADLLVEEQITGADLRHKDRRNRANPVEFLMAIEISRRRPQHNRRRSLVRPAEITPQYREMDAGQNNANDKQRNGD